MPKVISDIPYHFEGWLRILLPKSWQLEEDEEEAILNIFSSNNGQGAIQISFLRHESQDPEERAKDLLERFIVHVGLDIDINTKMILESDDYVIAQATGMSGGWFMKVWFIVEETRALHITYTSKKETKELDTVDDIVYSIEFD